jgi:hypothetical protein
MRVLPENKAHSLRAAREVLTAQIREAYPVDEEFRIINAGIADSADPEYIVYRQYIENLLAEYRAEKDKL